MSDDAQVGAISTIYRHNIGAVIQRQEQHITAAGLNITPDVTEKELVQFRSQVNNPANIQEFLERWEREEGDVEKGLREWEREGENDSDNLEIIISEDDDEDDEEGDDDDKDEDEDEEMGDFIVDNADENEQKKNED